MKTAITKNQYYQLVGLLALASEHRKSLDGIQSAMASLLEVEDEGGGYFGVVSDSVHEPYDVGHLLRMLEVDVISDTSEAA